ncbi:hypothetical protein [Salinarchaeum sp. Harcht-Bsk1]|uniref:hypothetical protein n=1 Tax=Salinarchaeum sp. Harcht-Bsk1 TaxID=1333523 RepID=UPI0016511350|nr:hypothetical protein [Salinarchaeum sp. Harcht-Bsk1]
MSTQGDASAQLGLNITDDSLAGGGQTIEFNEQDLNQNATTRYDASFVVTNNDASTTINSLTIEDGSGNSLVGNTSRVMYFETTGSTPLNSGGGSITYDVVFDTTNGDISEAPNEITIVAQN